MQNNSGVYLAIGLAKKAGKVVSGTDLCLQAVRSKKVYLVVFSEDISENTKKKIQSVCNNNGINCVQYGNGEMLGKMAGKDYRVVIGVKDKNLSKLILSKMQQKRELVNE